MEETQKTAIQIRQEEVDSYTANINNYTAILSGMNGEWDADLIHLKEIGGHEAAKLCPLDKIERLSELLFHDQIVGLIKTEMLERYKAQSILNALKLN